MTIQKVASFQPVRPVSPQRPLTFQVTRALLLALALALVGWGSVVAARLVAAPTLTVGIGETIQAGNLAFSIDTAEWISMNHDHDAEATNSVSLESDDADEAAIAAATLGFSMPPSMMPGLPKEGQQRLRLEVTFQNTGNGREAISADQFRVEAADGTVYLPLSNSSLRSMDLVAGQGIGVQLLVDVDETARSPRVIWERGGKQVALQIDGAPDHDH